MMVMSVIVVVTGSFAGIVRSFMAMFRTIADIRFWTLDSGQTDDPGEG